MRTTELEKLVDELRAEAGLPLAIRPRKITPALVRLVAAEVWGKIPGALTDPNYELGPLTLIKVEADIRRRLDDLERGAVVVQGKIPDWHFA